MKGTTPPNNSHGGGGDECQSSLSSSSSYSSRSTPSGSYTTRSKKKKQTFVVNDNDELSISQVISPCLSSNDSPLLQPAAAVAPSSSSAASSSILVAQAVVSEVSVTRTTTSPKETHRPSQHQPVTTFTSNNTSTILSSNNKTSSLSLFASSLLFGNTANDELEDVMLSSHHNTANCCNDDNYINAIDNDDEGLTTSLSSNASAGGGGGGGENNIDGSTMKSTTQHKYDRMALFYRSILGLLIVAILVAGPTIILVRTNSSSTVVVGLDTISPPSVLYNEDSWLNMRWHDTGNCLPNYRLANSTTSIYCNGVLDIETIQYYCQGLSMEPNHCTMPSSGYWSRIDDDYGSNDKAMIQQNLPYKFGIHDHHIDTDGVITTTTTTTTPHHYCHTMEDVIIGGTYTGNELYNQEWTPQSCSLIPVSPFEWTRNTKCQTTIIMMGDQHIRNLFTATINGLRGIDTFVESHENKHAKARGIAESYYWRLNYNGTAMDQFNEHVDTYAHDANLFEDCSCDNNNSTDDNNKVQRCLRIAFVWAPTFDDQLRQLHIVTNEQSDIVIVSPGNAAEVTNILPNEWMAAYQELLDEYNYLQLGIVHYPFGPQPTKERETILTNWTTNNVHASRMSVLNQHNMKHRPTTNNEMTKFACGLGKVNVTNDNIIAYKPCTDVTDTAQLRALITVHLDALVGH